MAFSNARPACVIGMARVSLSSGQSTAPRGLEVQASGPSNCRGVRSARPLRRAAVGARLQAATREDQRGLDREFVTLQAPQEFPAIHEPELRDLAVLVDRQHAFGQYAAVPVDVFDHIAGLAIAGP